MTIQIPDEIYLTVSRQESCAVSSVRRVAAMLDQDPDAWSKGDALPRGWQFILMGADTRRSRLRNDGFPGLGVPLPDFGLPRLMLAGRSVSFGNDIPIGSDVRRESRVEEVKQKEGRNGPIVFVTVLHELYTDDRSSAAVTERQTYVLMGAGQGEKVKPSEQRTLPEDARQLSIPDDTLIFSYSALGFNSHRIHIDREYATKVEGFPDLVVNGGLSTLLLTEDFRHSTRQPITTITARYLRPLFCAKPIYVSYERTKDVWTVKAYDDQHEVAVELVLNSYTP
ncbi:MaoC family dehydratase N-terminal domain-containing protein (plasmid) [Agrobacterium leguminum]|uniref:FAS1-like dehydratase domain-containing protein n=1 Tax=Agrobacterium deltaense NCPPB 1641 TaxID=1183425 RepID=A0A1S7U703_9HYPH|nr:MULTISPECIES: MaoC family dehydratase N-terminal domain-containing protein [Agrobacterium]WFS69800.1 MaoC family dehydratase N-terminal domain-containing protein [Agrobacterium leguminum]CVI62585.1 conserved hypothetical protein [Agrobacterium deltaense NCPPB 1641]